MAPRGRGRARKGQTRMDAALDAMKGYGFPEELIKSTIGDLLDVYGLDGWPFIEETSYKVLLDNILEKVEKQANDNEKDDSLRSDNEGVSPAGSSIMAPGPTHSNREIFPIELPQETASEVTEVLENAKVTKESVCNAYAEGEGSSGKDTNAEHECNKNQTNNVRGTEDGSSSAAGEVGRSRSHCPSEFGIGSEEEEAAKAFLSRSYHGWISDSDEPPELMELKPARLADKFAELLSGTNVSKNRKRRWDVNPEDIRAL